MKKLFFILMLLMIIVTVNAQGGAKDRVTFNVSSSLLSSPQNVSVPAEELPKAITDNVAKEHSGFTIKEAKWDWSTSLVPNNIFVYEVTITDGKKDEVLLFNKDGKFLKKGIIKPEDKEK